MSAPPHPANWQRPARTAARWGVSLLLLGAGTNAAAAAAADSRRGPPDGPRATPYAQAVDTWRDADSRFADLDGVRVHYKDEGRGPAVLLVHGSFGDLWDWDGWARELRARYRVVRFDRPGAGLTGPLPNDNYSLDRQLALVDALMDSLGIERFAIVGASLGGPVAFRYAATRTHRVTALVLLNSAGIEYGGRRGTGAPPARDSYGWLTAPAVARVQVRESLSTIVNDPAVVTDALVERKFAFNVIEGRDREAKATIATYERGDPARILGAVRAPALVQWGSANAALSTSTADAFVAALKRAATVRKVLYDGGGHMLHVERPAATARDAADFLDVHARGDVGLHPVDAARAQAARAVGLWTAEAAYLDGELQPNIPRYGALLQVEAAGDGLVHTEWKYYAASPTAAAVARSFGAPAPAEGEGIALVTRHRGLPVGSDGRIDFGPEAGLWLAVDGAMSAGFVPAPGDAPARYRMLTTFAGDDRMVRAVLGFRPDGTVMGLSLFRYVRVPAERLESERRRLEAEYSVATEIDRTGERPVTRRVRDPAAAARAQ